MSTDGSQHQDRLFDRQRNMILTVTPLMTPVSSKHQMLAAGTAEDDELRLIMETTSEKLQE
jgi:hypothetical protein